MDILVIVLVIVLLLCGGGVWYADRPGYDGPAVGGPLGVLLLVVAIVLVVRLVGG